MTIHVFINKITNLNHFHVPFETGINFLAHGIFINSFSLVSHHKVCVELQPFGDAGNRIGDQLVSQ